MQTFSDSTGRKWNIELPFGTVVRVKKESGGKFNLLDSDTLPKRLQEDLAEFWEVLWHLIEPQAIAAGVTADQFGALMSPDLLVLAHTNFFREWADFFRNLQHIHVAVMLEKMAAYTTQGVEMIREKLNQENLATVDAKTAAKMRATLNEEFGNLLASLD